MLQKCLTMAILAALLCHPSLTIKCFKPTTSPHRENPHPHSPKASTPGLKKLPSKSKKKDRHHTKSSPSKALSVATELDKGEPPFKIVGSIFESGWTKKATRFTIDKILKINHSANTIVRFEEYRKIVKAKHAKTSVRNKIERLAVDGNELLKFHGAIITCSFGMTNGTSDVCKEKCCGVCRMISCCFSPWTGIIMPFYNNSWEAHKKVSFDCVTNGVSPRKAMIVCRVIAGHVGRYMNDSEGYPDSMLGLSRCGSSFLEELLVLNPRAVLPCFVVIYNEH